MQQTVEQIQDAVLDTFGKVLDPNSAIELGEQFKENFPSMSDGFDIPNKCYKPSVTLKKRLSEFNDWKKGIRTGEDAGKLLEEIAYLAFKCIANSDSIKSFQSYSAQHDLVVSGGNNSTWWFLLAYLHILQKKNGRSILIECKNTGGKVTDEIFTRLCSLLHVKYSETCYLGVFLSPEGATGFPGKDGDTDASRQRKLNDARASQILFHAKTGKFIVVLTLKDIESLGEDGALLRILEAKIRDLEDASGIELNFTEDYKEVDLPPHLNKWVKK